MTNPAAKLETLLAILAALDLEFRIAPRAKATSADIEDVFRRRAGASMRRCATSWAGRRPIYAQR